MSRQIYRYALAIYTLALIVGSLQPLRPGGLHDSGLHPLLHVASFGLLVLLARTAFPGRGSLVWIVPACILLGATLEFAQHLEYREATEWGDIGEDAIGAAVAGLLSLLW